MAASAAAFIVPICRAASTRAGRGTQADQQGQPGHQMNANLHQYQLPFSMEIPEIEIILIESYDATTSTDAVGIGEPPIIATAPAIANAIYDAIGVRITQLPITPERVLAALREKQGLDLCGQAVDKDDAAECIIEE